MAQFVLPTLPYSHNALEPFIDAKTMEIHHSKHHATYIEKLNLALEKYPDFADMEIESILKDLAQIPGEIRTAVRNHGGGYYNHSFFWNMLSTDKILSDGKLKELLDKNFESVEGFKKSFTESALGLFGSGWTWLVKHDGDKLSILNTANQDNPISDTPDCKILLGVDVWEHAYYLKYQNKRADYLEAFWNVVNWEYVESLV